MIHDNTRHYIRRNSNVRIILMMQAKQAAQHMAHEFESEDGVAGAVGAFYKNLPKGIRHGAHSLTWMKEKDWTFGLARCMTRSRAED